MDFVKINGTYNTIPFNALTKQSGFLFRYLLYTDLYWPTYENISWNACQIKLLVDEYIIGYKQPPGQAGDRAATTPRPKL